MKYQNARDEYASISEAVYNQLERPSVLQRMFLNQLRQTEFNLRLVVILRYQVPPKYVCYDVDAAQCCRNYKTGDKEELAT